MIVQSAAKIDPDSTSNILMPLVVLIAMHVEERGGMRTEGWV